MNTNEKIDLETLQRLLHLQTVFNTAVAKAQVENRSLGIPNWYSINGKIVSDQQIEQIGTVAEEKK